MSQFDDIKYAYGISFQDDMSIVPKRFLWELCNRWLIHVEHRQYWHGPFVTSSFIIAVSSRLNDSEISLGMNDGDYEYLGLKVRRDE